MRLNYGRNTNTRFRQPDQTTHGIKTNPRYFEGLLTPVSKPTKPQIKLGDVQTPGALANTSPDMPYVIKFIVDFVTDRRQSGLAKLFVGMGGTAYVIQQHKSDVSNLARGTAREWVFDEDKMLPSRESVLAFIAGWNTLQRIRRPQ